MPEREFYDYDDWMNSGGDPTYGQAVSQPQTPPMVGGEALSPTYTANNPPPPGSAPAGTQWMLNPTTGQFEPIQIGTVPPWGLRSDEPNQHFPETPETEPWKPPPPPGPGGDGPFPRFGGNDGGGFGSLDFPSYNPLSFDPGPAFTFREFTAPNSQSMLQEPGFQFRMDQGRKALESSAAGKGVLRSGGTLKDILSYGQNFASHEYGNVYDRALKEYDTNRNNAFGNWQSQYGQRRDKYGFDEDANRFGFNAKQRQVEFDADDIFRRWAKEGDWLSETSRGGMD